MEVDEGRVEPKCSARGSTWSDHKRVAHTAPCGEARHEFIDGVNMSLRVVRLGSQRSPGEGTRIGTVRRPPRGVPKSEYSVQNWYDVWFPNLAPSAETMKFAQAATTASQWSAFIRKFKAEMNVPERKHELALLARLSHTANFSVGCYCEREDRCHRSILKQLLIEHGARVE